MTINTQAFFMGYGQKEARNPIKIVDTIKSIVGAGKKLVDSGAKGVVTGVKAWDKNPYLSIGAPIGVGTGTGLTSYLMDENPDKGVLSHALRGAGTGASLSPKYYKALFKNKPGEPKDFMVPGLVGAGTSVTAVSAPFLAEKARQVGRTVDQVEQATMHAQEGTGNIGDMVAHIQDVTLDRIDSALNQLTTTMEQFTDGVQWDDVALQAIKKKLPIIAGALAVAGVGGYAIHKYIGYRLAKAVEKVPKDEAAAAASTLARRLRGDEYGIEELEEEALKAE